MDNTQTCLVSVIMPVYNGHDYVADCIESVINQTYKNIEIIIVNDASTDDSLQICQNFAKRDNRIKIIDRKQNGGQSESRNDGVSVAKGQWIAFIDNDDTYEPQFLEVVVGNAIKHNVLVSGCANKRIEPNKTIIADINGKKSGLHDADEIAIGIMYKPAYTWVEVWSKVFHKSLRDKLIFPKGAQLEDYLVVIPILHDIDKVYFDNRPLYNWIIRKTSQSEQLFFNNKLTYMDSTEKLRNWIISNNSNKDYINAVYTWEYGVKCRLLEDMVKTGNVDNIKLAKKMLPEVAKLKKNVSINKQFTIKSAIHCYLRLLNVKRAKI